MVVYFVLKTCLIVNSSSSKLEFIFLSKRSCEIHKALSQTDYALKIVQTIPGIRFTVVSLLISMHLNVNCNIN